MTPRGETDVLHIALSLRMTMAPIYHWLRRMMSWSAC